MRTAQQLREGIQDLRDELKAIVAVADKEQRELTDEEDARVTEIHSSIESDEKALERRNKIDAEFKAQAASRMSEQLEEQEAENSGDPAARLSRLKVPARAKIHGKLTAFDNERDAYVAGNFFLAHMFGNDKAIGFCRDHGLIQNTMTSGFDGLKGGFLIPDELSSSIIRLREERGVFPRFANSMPMGSDNISIPRLINDVTAYWVGEGSEITASDAELGQAKLVAEELACLTKFSKNLDQDAVVSVGDMITTSMAYAMADKIDEAGFNGDGSSAYGGITGLKNALNSAAINVAASGNVSAKTLDMDDFEATVALYPAYTGASPRWFMNSAVYWNGVARLQLAETGNTVRNAAGGPEMMFLGYPVEFVQVMPTGTAVSTIVAYFGDLRLTATVGTRQGVQTDVSMERYFELNLIGLRATQRIAINVHERGDTIRTRPMVALKTAAS